MNCEYYYTVDEITNDPTAFLPVVVSKSDTETTETYDFLETLGLKAAEDFYILDGGRPDLSEWPIDFHLYDEEKVYLGGFSIQARRIGNFGINFALEALPKSKEAA